MLVALSRNGGGRIQRRVLTKHRGLQLSQLWSRVDAELVGQDSPGPLVRLQRVTLPAGPVQGQDQLAPQPLTQRMLTHQVLELAGQLAMATEHQLGVDPVLGRGQPRFLQPGDHARREPGVRELSQRPPAPQAERLAQQPSCPSRVLAPQRRASAGGELAEPGGVQGRGRDLEGIAPGPGQDAVTSEHLAQAGNVHLQAVAVTQSLTRPHLVQQLVGWHRTAFRQGQRDQQRLRKMAADVHQLAIVADQLERPENPDLHLLPC